MLAASLHRHELCNAAKHVSHACSHVGIHASHNRYLQGKVVSILNVWIHTSASTDAIDTLKCGCGTSPHKMTSVEGSNPPCLRESPPFRGLNPALSRVRDIIHMQHKGRDVLVRCVYVYIKVARRTREGKRARSSVKMPKP